MRSFRSTSFLARARALVAAVVLSMPAAALALGPGPTTVLYDGALDTVPTAQGWLLASQLGSILLPGAQFGVTQVAANDSVVFDTTANTGIRSGYSNFLTLGTLDSAGPGFRLSMRAHVISESHVTNDRAGFSLIVLDRGGKGIELGFWGNEVWAQRGPGEAGGGMFTHGEGAAFDTLAGFADYDLTLASGSYTLAMNRGTTSASLSGIMRDYSSFGFPYTSKDYVFVGDNTGSAQARIAIASISVTPVPEPETWALLAIGLMTVLTAARRGRARG